MDLGIVLQAGVGVGVKPRILYCDGYKYQLAEDYVIATGVQHSIGQFCEAAFARVDLDWKKYVRVDPAFKRPAEVDLLVGNPTKILEKCGWRATVSFKDLVEMMVDFLYKVEAPAAYIVADSPASARLAEAHGMERVESPVYRKIVR